MGDGGTVSIQIVEPAGKKWQRFVLDVKYSALAVASYWMVPAKFVRSLAETRTFCCFIGHGRSGGTLVGALLNAHPNIVMSNELNAIRRLRIGITEAALYRIIYLVSKRQASRGSRGGGGYTYSVPGQWQGNYKRLLVIGDRKAGASAHEIITHPEVLEKLGSTIRLPKRFIHVVRNPFDTIATTFRKTLRGDAKTERLHLDREIRNYFLRCEAVRMVESRFGKSSVYFLHHEQLLEDPHSELTNLCEFLGVPPYQDYLSACAGILASEPHKTRNTVHWDSECIANVVRNMRDFHWLKRYTLTD